MSHLSACVKICNENINQLFYFNKEKKTILLRKHILGNSLFCILEEKIIPPLFLCTMVTLK